MPEATKSTTTPATRWIPSNRSGQVKSRFPGNVEANFVTVEDVGAETLCVEFAFQDVDDGKFTEAGKAGDPEALAGVAVEFGASLPVDCDGLAVAFAGAAQRVIDYAGAGRLMGLAVDSRKNPIAGSSGTVRRRSRGRAPV